MDETEKQARDTGWLPKEEFKGDTEKWKPAEEWVDWAGDRVGPLKADLESVKRELSESRKAMSDYMELTKKTSKKAAEDGFKRAKREYENDIRDLRAQLKSAVKDDDPVAVTEIERRMDSLEPPEKPVESATSDGNNGDTPIVNEFKQRNQWYESDYELRLYADSIWQFCLKRHNGNEMLALKAVEDETKQRFPDKFENQNQRKPNQVEGDTGTGPPAKSNAKTFDNLPQEAKTSYERMAKNFKMMGHEFTKEIYLEQYEWSE